MAGHDPSTGPYPPGPPSSTSIQPKTATTTTTTTTSTDHPSPSLQPYPYLSPHPPPSPSSRSHYYHYYHHSRADARHGYPTRPQSALVRGSGHPYVFDSVASAGLTAPSSRRPSAAYSLPQPQTRRTPTPPSPSRLARSENASIVEHKTTRPAPVFHHHPASTRDLEIKQQPSLLASQHSPPPGLVSSTYSQSDDDEEEERTAPTVRQTLRSLLHLALSAVPLSFGILLYTLCCLIYAIFTSPLKLCVKSRPCITQQLTQLLLPPLNVQRRCIFLQSFSATPSRSSSSSRTPLSSDEAVQSNASVGDIWPISAGSLLTTHFLAPIVAFPLAFGAWIMAAAWGLGAMVSDERAGDDRDERRLAERLVSWWAGWLSWGLAKGSGDDEEAQAGRGRQRGRQEMSMRQEGNWRAFELNGQ